MSIATTVRTAGPFAGTGSLVALPFAFKVFAASDLVVQRTNVAGDVATLTLTTHYSVSLNADQDTSPGGTVTLVTALAVGETAALTSSVSATQPLQLASGGPFLPGQIEDALDRAMIVVQQQGVLGEQALRVPLGETALILPSADQRANKALLFDADGDPYLAAPASGSAADVMLQYASTASGKGAALVGVEDAGGRFTATNGEAVVAELSDRPVRRVKDPKFGGIGNGVADDTAALAAIVAAKDAATTLFQIPVGTYLNSAQISVTGYQNIHGYGDQSQIKLTTGGITGLAYTSQTGVFDDHPHNVTRDFRITGDGTFVALPGAQNGTTTGQNHATTALQGSFGSASGMTYELHNIGRIVDQTFVHNGEHNHYRANKIGIQLDETTSFTESNSYFRYNSTAAVDIIGGQNITLRGGAIEGNPGIAIRYTTSSSSWSQLNIDNVYLELNGNEATGVWSVDIPFGAPTMVNISGGSLWRNTASGYTSGPYKLGDNAIIDGATLNGAIYAKYASVRNTRGTPSWNTFASEATARLFGLMAPVTMLEFSPARHEYNFAGATGGLVIGAIVKAKTGAKIPGITNLANYTYPYGFSAASGAVGAANAAINYGDGDFFQVTHAASVGNFSSNYASLISFTDTAKPFRVMCAIVYPASNCEIGVVQSVGGQSITANFALTANTYYKILFCAFAPMTAASFLRIFPLNTAAPVINYLPIWASAHSTHSEQLGIMQMLVDGTL